jgi:3-oxoacyl-ACP reductase-like protein
MELSPARQRLLFVGIVAALAVFGYFLVVPGLRSHASPATKVTGAPSTPAAAVPSTAAPVATSVPAGAVNIYDWLPFTQQDLADAAAVATRFSVDYDTFTYTESATAYIAKMAGLITGQLAATLQNAYSAPGVAQLRTGKQQVATATASIESLRGFGQSSLVFIVSIAQRMVTAQGTSNGTYQYAVTLTGNGASWQVSDVELATLGNN